MFVKVNEPKFVSTSERIKIIENFIKGKAELTGLDIEIGDENNRSDEFKKEEYKYHLNVMKERLIELSVEHKENFNKDASSYVHYNFPDYDVIAYVGYRFGEKKFNDYDYEKECDYYITNPLYLSEIGLDCSFNKEELTTKKFKF